MLIDIGLRIISDGPKEFFSIKLNIIDVFLIVMSILSIILFLKYYFYSTIGEIEDLTIGSLLLLRNITQFIRILVLIKNQKHIKETIKDDKCFNKLIHQNKIEMMRLPETDKENCKITQNVDNFLNDETHCEDKK